MRGVVRWIRHAWDNTLGVVGIVVCILMLVVLMPLVPVLRFYDDVRRMYEDD